jgi:hypothetical protein
MAAAVQRTWMRGEVNMEGPRPVRELADEISVRAATGGLDLRSWDVSASRGVTTASATVEWNDPVAGKVLAAVVIRDGTVAACEWGIVADAGKGWSCGAVPPCVRLGLEGEGVCDPSGVPLSAEPSTLPVDYAPGAPDLHEAMMAGFWSATRSVGILTVTLGARQAEQSLANAAAASWPGLITVTVVSEDGRRALSQLMPQRHIPAGGARFFATSFDGLDDAVYSKTALRQPGPFAELCRRMLAARALSAPSGPAATAAALLPEPRAATAPAPTEADVDRLRRQAGELEDRLAEARQQITLKSQALKRAEDDRDAALAEAARLRACTAAGAGAEATARQLADALAERDLYEAAYEEAQAERDAAVRERSRLAGRLAAATREDLTAEPAGSEQEPGTFRDLLDGAARRYELLVFDHLDTKAAAALDLHPKAASWRRKTADALATLAAYAQAKQAARGERRPPGPHLADLLAFVRSGGPGAVITASTIALSESATVSGNEKYRQARTFAVRPGTGPGGTAYFGAHIKIERFKAPAPRLHFYDDTDATGLIYIGYCGPHLPTGKTN